MERPSEHLEHIEHQEHAAHNPFDKRVALSMAIIAASLAAVTMLSHKAHNETLLYQSQASDQWTFYQAKNIRQHEYEAFLLLLGSVAREPGKEAVAKKAEDEWTRKVAKYNDELPEMQEKAKKLEEMSHAKHQMAARFDLGELGIELALVFCSLAVLTKRVGFWMSGILVGGIGLLVALSAYVWLPH
jgi:hypothetical protein